LVVLYSLMPDDLSIGYEIEERDKAWYISEGLLRIYERLGKPEVDISSPTFWLMIDQIVLVWHKLFPKEVADWEHDRAIDLAVERSISESAKSGFARMGAYPPTLFRLLKGFYPDIPLSKRPFQRQFFNRYPLFRTTKYRI